MNIILLAAGVGSRLFPHTKNTPKCLLEIDGKHTILDKTLSLLHSVFPAANTVAVLGFEAVKILDKLKQFPNRVHTVLNPFYRVTNSIASLWFAREFLAGDVLLLNADVCISEAILRKIARADLEAFVVMDSSVKCSDADYKVVVEGGQVVEMGKNISAVEYHGEYCGMTVLKGRAVGQVKQKVEAMVEAGEYDTWYETAIVNLIEQGDFEIQPLDIQGEVWSEIDTAKDLDKIRKYYRPVAP